MSDNEELKGAFFVDGNCQIMSKGTITVNGATRYCSLLKAQSQKGEEIYELAVSAGRVYYNPPEKKQNPKSPDVSGKVTIDGQGYKFGAWNKCLYLYSKTFSQYSILPIARSRSTLIGLRY